MRTAASMVLVCVALLGCKQGPARTPESPRPTGGARSVPSTAPSARLVPPKAPARIPVAFVISPEAEVVDFSGPWGVFEYVSVPGYDDSVFELFTVAERDAPVRVSGGLTIVPTYTFENAPAPRVIVVPAQLDPTARELEWIKKAAGSADLTISVCNGAFVLGKAGLLAGKPATAHHGGYALLAATFPDVEVRRGARFVDADRVSTAGGLTSGIDLALHVVERYFGRDVAEKTAEALEYQGQGWKDPNSNVRFAVKPVSTREHPICPVCEMEVEKGKAPHQTFRGQEVFFCSEQDQATFNASPERFIGTR